MLTNKDDIKIFILYIMNSIDYSVDYDTLHDMCVQDGFVTSFDFIECFDELVNTGNIEKISDENGGELVSVTKNGKHIADTLNGRLLLSIKEKSLKSALRLLSFKKRGTKISSSATELPHGKYEFHCVLEESDGELLNLTLTLENKKQLERVMYNFENQPEFIYRGLLALMSGEANYLLN